MMEIQDLRLKSLADAIRLLDKAYIRALNEAPAVRDMLYDAGKYLNKQMSEVLHAQE